MRVGVRPPVTRSGIDLCFDRYHRRVKFLGLVQYKHYDREDVARALGVQYVESIWRQGVVRLDRFLLFVTLSKKDLAREYQYADTFLSDSIFRWQSQNREE